MTSDAEARRLLQEHGREVGARGRLSAAQWAEYADLAGEPPTVDLGDPQTADPRPDPLVSGPAADPLMEEQAPRRVQTGPTGAGRVRQLWDKRPRGEAPPKGRAKKPAGGRAKKKPARPWQPTHGLIEHVWERLAQAAGGLPPVQRIFAVQAPLAGMVFEPRLRDTVIDRVLLQPAARWEAQGEAVSALIGMPLFAALAIVKGRAQLGELPDGETYVMMKPDGTPRWTPETEAAIIAPLRYCIGSWLDISDRYASDVIEHAEATIRKGAEADKVMAWIFTGVRPDESQDAPGPAYGPPPGAYEPEPGPGAPPEPARPSSAFRPALSVSVLPA